MPRDYLQEYLYVLYKIILDVALREWSLNIGAEIIVAIEDRALVYPIQCCQQRASRWCGAIFESTAIDPSTLVVGCCKTLPLISGWSNDCNLGFEV